VTIPDSYSLWASAPTAIQSWNMAGETRGVIQIIILVMIIIAGVYVFNRFVKEFTARDSEE
jgi:flagellar biogenesis protein FliO